MHPPSVVIQEAHQLDVESSFTYRYASLSPKISISDITQLTSDFAFQPGILCNQLTEGPLSIRQLLGNGFCEQALIHSGGVRNEIGMNSSGGVKKNWSRDQLVVKKHI